MKKLEFVRMSFGENLVPVSGSTASIIFPTIVLSPSFSFSNFFFSMASRANFVLAVDFRILIGGSKAMN
jgi:hypothetical protein